MTNWTDWMTWYAAAFSLRSDQDTEMLRVWVELFASRGWTPDEVATACRQHFDRLAGVRYRTQHLEVISEGVEALRRSTEVVRRHEQESDPRGICCDCAGSGMMSGMPHPSPPPGQPWVTCAVLCHCALGHWMAQQQQGDRKRRMMTYDEYTRCVPDWRERQQAYHAFLQARAAAQATAGALDRTLGSILKRAAQKTAPETDPGF